MNESEFRPQGDSKWLKTFGLNLVDLVECDFTNCREESVWWFSVQCCNHIYLMCDDHTNRTMNTVNTLGQDGAMKCKECTKTVSTIDNFTAPRKLK